MHGAAGELPGRRAPTLEAATSWAVLAAISREQTISSSNVPLPCTTRSAASLREGRKGLEHPLATPVPSPWGQQDPAVLSPPPVMVALTP